MYCKFCGNLLGEKDSFCTKCGKAINQKNERIPKDEKQENDVLDKSFSIKEDMITNEPKEETPREVKRPSNKKSKIGLYLIAVILIAMLAGGSIFTIDYLNNKKIAKTVPIKIEQYEEKWVAINSNDEEKEDFEELLDTLDEAAIDYNVDLIKESYRDIDDLFLQVEKRNKKELQAKIDELASNTGDTYEGEKKIIESYKSKLEDLLSKGKYADASISETISQWEAINSAIQGNPTYDMAVEQIDVSNFPTVKVYLRVADPVSGEIPKGLLQDKFYLYEQANSSGEYLQKEIKKAVQLNELENMNINIVADASDSMSGDPIIAAKTVMNNFVNSIQFNIGDKTSLITFNSQVNASMPFTSDVNVVKNSINNITTSDLTALYDALYVAINQTASQNGAKCIIAFTDGMDNSSNCTPQIVTDLANRFKIPIFIIGVGAGLEAMTLENIANGTGGFYRNINDISSMEEIYKQIYRKQKELYLVEYVTSKDENTLRDININYIDKDIVIRNKYEYTPMVYMEAIKSSAQLFVNDFIIYDSDSRFLTISDLEKLNQDELKLARNEIYARRGRKFVDQNLQTYFNSKAWYKPTIEPESFNEGYFNDYEKANAYFIRDYERLKGYLK